MSQIISTFGLGILGIDPITAVYLLAMGLRSEKKTKISLFFFSFAGFTIVVGATLASVFGITAVDFLKNILPGDSSPLWAIVKFAIAIFIFIWVFRKLFFGKKQRPDEKKEPVSGDNLKYITTGFLFAVASFTDPTFYAVMLIGGESGNFLTAICLLALWFLVSQFMAVVVYIANEMNLLNKLVHFVERLKQRKWKWVSYLLYTVLIVVAIVLIVDSGVYLFTGRYLF